MVVHYSKSPLFRNSTIPTVRNSEGSRALNLLTLTLYLTLSLTLLTLTVTLTPTVGIVDLRNSGPVPII